MSPPYLQFSPHSAMINCWGSMTPLSQLGKAFSPEEAVSLRNSPSCSCYLDRHTPAANTVFVFLCWSPVGLRVCVCSCVCYSLPTFHSVCWLDVFNFTWNNRALFSEGRYFGSWVASLATNHVAGIILTRKALWQTNLINRCLTGIGKVWTVILVPERPKCGSLKAEQ